MYERSAAGRDGSRGPVRARSPGRLRHTCAVARAEVQLAFRDAEPRDAAAIAAVHVRSWQAGYRGLFPADFLAALRPEDRAARYTLGSADPEDPQTLLALAGGQVAGFVTVGPTRDADVRGAGEIHALYVDPPRWGAGVGGALLARGCERLLERGHTAAVLWVLDGNTRAARMYEAHGWRADGATRLEDPWGIVARVHRYRRAFV